MTTKNDLIAAALGSLGIASFIFDATPEQLQDAVGRMNRMAATWDGMGIRLGYNFGTDINAESGIPDTAEECFVENLAVRIGPTFGKVPSAETKIAARQGFNAMLTARAVIPTVPRPSNMPVGAGNRVGVMGRQYFPETTEVEGLNDGATEY